LRRVAGLEEETGSSSTEVGRVEVAQLVGDDCCGGASIVMVRVDEDEHTVLAIEVAFENGRHIVDIT
jgi:hypothetical protein